MGTKQADYGALWTDRLKYWADAERLREHEDQVLLVLTLIIGALVGLVVVAFILLTENLGARMYPEEAPFWRRLLIPIVGALITGPLLMRYFPNARGSGVPQTKAALFIRDGYIRFSTVLGKFFCSSISLASGIALGREGPSVQVGAGIASALGRRLGLSRSKIRALVPIGSAAALAAAFNTPIAAVLFTLEEVMGDLHAPVLGSIVLSSATSWIVLHLLLGDEPLFHVPAYQLVHPLEFPLYALLGVIGGLVSVWFVKFLLWQRKHFLALSKGTEWLQPTAGGLVVGVLGVFVPQVLGVGYGFVGQALNGKMALGIMALLVVLKIQATTTCYASGNAGGIFGPSLFIGAMMGGAFGSAAHHLLPDYTGSVGAYALVGMGAAFAGIIRVPLTSVIMIFEITRDYSIIVPLMIANLISFFISHRLQRTPIYESLQHQEGIHLPAGGGSRGGLLLVGRAMRPASEIFWADKKVTDYKDFIEEDERKAWPVLGEDGLLGMLSVARLRAAVESGLHQRALAEIMPHVDPQVLHTAEEFPHVHADHPLDTVMRRMADTKLTVLPVVSRANLRELIGVVSLNDVMDAYGLGKGERETPQLERMHAEPRRQQSLLTALSAVLFVVFLLGGFFTYYYGVQRHQRAQEYFQQGNDLVQQGRTDTAIELYRNALSISHSPEHRLALGVALLSAGRLDEARIYLREVLEKEPKNGLANLAMARVSDQQGRTKDAVSYYRQAIAGVWPSGSEDKRIEAHFELVKLLERTGQKIQALAELGELQQQTPQDLAVQKEVAQMLLQFGARQESADLYREILRRGDDAAAYAGLGQAEFALEHYRDARDAFLSALKLEPNYDGVQNRLHVTEEILALDPTLRGLASRERYRRSQRLVEGASGSLEQCVALKMTGTADDALKKLSEAAEKALSTTRPRSYGDATEDNIALAEQLWVSRTKLCGPVPASQEALSRVLDRLSR